MAVCAVASLSGLFGPFGFAQDRPFGLSGHLVYSVHLVSSVNGRDQKDETDGKDQTDEIDETDENDEKAVFTGFRGIGFFPLRHRDRSSIFSNSYR
mgnify:CR=1 FL=1